MGCIFSFKWLLAIIGLNVAGFKGGLLGFLLGMLVDNMLGRPNIHFTFYNNVDDLFGGGTRSGDGSGAGSGNASGAGHTGQTGGGAGRAGANDGQWGRAGGQWGSSGGGYYGQPPMGRQSITLGEAYRRLGLSERATDSEVRQAYRRMALQFHPDRFSSQGEQAQRDAERIFQEIGEARDIIFKARGLR